MTAPEKAAPIPAEDAVDTVASMLALNDGRKYVCGPDFDLAYKIVRALAEQDRADRASQEERIREDERATAAERDVLAERRRQVEGEGWTPEHDDAHEDEELAAAAGCYAWPSWTQQGGGDLLDPPDRWPWADSAWRPTNRRQMLVKAGALILAEIERLDRARLRGDAS